MKIRQIAPYVLFLLLAASMAQAGTPTEVQLDSGQVAILMDGAPTDWQNLPWSDQILHSAPVMERGLAPIKVREGYEVISLPQFDWNGRKIYCYVGWTSRSWEGKKIWMRIRPNEAIEARSVEQIDVQPTDGQAGKLNVYDTDIRFVRCANPGGVAAFRFVPVYVQTKTVPGPERIREVPKPYPVYQPYGIPYPVFRTKTQLVYAAQPVPIETPHSKTYTLLHGGIVGNLLGIGQAYAGRTRINITATGGTANSSAAAAANADADATNNTNVDVDNTNVNVNENQQQQQQ